MKILSMLVPIIYSALILSWPVGMAHSYKSHSTKDFIATIALFPWGMYRGFEMFWHKDESSESIDWDKRLNNDLRASIYIVTEGSYPERNVVEMNKSTEDFTSHIKDYPADKRTYLENGTKTYILYTLEAAKDNYELVNSYYESGKIQVIFSEATDSLKKILSSTYKLDDLIQPLEEMTRQQAKKMEGEPFKKYTIDELKDLRSKYWEKMDAYLSKTESGLMRVYKNIYNEDLNLTFPSITKP